ncbi:MAG: ABC transporter substrate-binding protein [Sphingobium sp.]
MSIDDDPIGDIPDHPDRRTALALLGGGAVAALGGGAWLLSRGAGARAGEAVNADAGPPRRGGELVFAFDGGGGSRFLFDPHKSGYAPHNRVMRAVFDNLTVLNEDESVGPWLAQGWDVSPDGRTYVFRLRPGVVFHDGTPFDAAAVKANFERLADPENALYSRQDIGRFTGGRIIDPLTVELNFAEPFVPLLRNLSMTKLAMVSPVAAAKGNAEFALRPVGSGPFIFDGMTPGTEIRLKRNPAYDWPPSNVAGHGAAWLDRLTFRNVPEEATRVAVTQSGQALGSDLVPPQNMAVFKGDPTFRFLEKELLETNYSLVLNVTRPPWDDVDIRRAVRQAINVDAIVKAIYLGVFPRAWSSLSPSMFASAEQALKGSWAFDPEGAARILEAKGWRPGPDGIRVRDGRRLTISFLDSQGNREKRLDVVELVRRQLARVGIALSVDSVPPTSLQTTLKGNRYDMTGGASFHADPDMLRHSYDPTARSIGSGARVDDPYLIEWVRAAARESDPARRAELYRRIQFRVVDQAYAIPIYVLLYNLVVSHKVRGVALDAHGFPDFYSAWIAT